MKIAIAATSSKADAHVDSRGARAACYWFFDSETGSSEVIVNPVSENARRAGPETAAFLLHQGVDKVVAGDFGQRFRGALEAAGVICIKSSATVAAVLNEESL